MRSYSSGVRPWRSRTAASNGIDVIDASAPAATATARRLHDRLEQHEAVGAADRELAGALGMRHQADDVAALVADAGDVRRAIRSDWPASVVSPCGVRVAEDDAAARLERRERLGRRVVVALRRARSAAAAPGPLRRRAVNGVSVCSTRTPTNSQWNFRSRLRSIAPGSRPHSSRIWNPLQMPSTGPPAAANVGDGGHDRREPRDGAGAQVVAVREPAGQNHDVGAAERRLLVPDERRLLAEHVLRGVVRVVIAVRSGKDDDGERHRVTRSSLRSRASSSMRKLSITGLASTRSATSAASVSASPAFADAEVELEVLALPHVGDGVVAERVQRLGDRVALRIEHRRLQA